jgi:sec-independent protein translocase protein TatC
MASNEHDQPGVPGNAAGDPGTTDSGETYGYPGEPRLPAAEYASGDSTAALNPPEGDKALVPATAQPPAQPPASPPPAKPEDGDGEEDGMLRMSFLEHLEELRMRLIRALMGMAVGFFACIYFSNELWALISRPATSALKALGLPPELVFTTPMEAFSTIWVKVPMLASVFVASPWVLYQVWAFIAPGLYKRERRWAGPFVLCTAGLFILGGLFAYFVAFRFGLTFLLGIGRDVNVKPMVTITDYFDLFVNVTLGIGLVFEMPILIFFLILLRIVTPKFLLSNSRYAILIITIVAAIVTPTPDIFNLMLFATPMCLLYYVGIFAGHIAIAKRETGRYPWKVISIVLGSPLVLLSIGVAVAILRYGFHAVPYWPFLVK